MKKRDEEVERRDAGGMSVCHDITLLHVSLPCPPSPCDAKPVFLS